MGSIIKVNEYKDFGNNAIMTSDGAGVITPNADGIKNVPAFSAYQESDTSISSATYTKVLCNIEEYDTNSAYDNSSNYRFTVPSGAAGKYLFGAGLMGRSTSDDVITCSVQFYKNGSAYANAVMGSNGTSNAAFRGYDCTRTLTIDMAVADYMEFYTWIQGTSPIIQVSTKGVFFWGYKLLT